MEESAGLSAEKQDHRDLVTYQATADEWSEVADITPQFKRDGRDPSEREGLPALGSPLTTLDQTLEYLHSGVLDTYLAQVSEPPMTSLDLLLNCFCLKPLPHNLSSTKQLVLATALIPFQNEEKIHLSILRTLYRLLTGSQVDCPRYGAHWEDIGFQGSDPATDLRGVGFLGLVHALYLTSTPELLPFARDVYALSRKESQEFPLMVLSLNVTRISLHILRDNLLNSQIIKDNDVWTSFNFLYGAVMYHIYHVWKSQHKTISSTGFVLKDAEEFSRGNVGRVIGEFERVLNTNYSLQDKQAAREQIRQWST